MAGQRLEMPVGGRLRAFLGAWLDLGDDTVVNIIEHGLRLELAEMPVQESLPHRLLAPEQEEVFRNEVQALIEKKGVKVLEYQQKLPAPRTFVSAGFCVPKPEGWRPVIDMRELNYCIVKRHFKMESLRTVRDMILPGDFMVKIDIKDAYLHVPVAEEHQPFLRFNFDQKTYQCLVMLFGLTSAPRVFTRVMLPVVKKLREEGIRIVVYLDDLLILARSPQEAAAHRDRTLALLMRLGWLVNGAKSVLTPAQQMTYLGVVINSNNMTFSLGEEKLRKLRDATLEMLQLNQQGRLSLRHAARVLGTMTAAAQGIELARLEERPLLIQVQERLAAGAAWDETIRLQPETVRACAWWLEEFRQWNGVQIIEPSSETHVLTTDASQSGYGVTIVACNGSLDARTQWCLPRGQEHRSSNWRELSAIAFAIERHGPALQGATIKIRSDNATSLACIRNQGSRSADLTEVAAKILRTAARWRIRLILEFIPGVHNIAADNLSRWFRSDPFGYQINPIAFNTIQQQWGPLSIDLFASDANRLLPRFFSWGYSEEAEGIDALRQSWPAQAFAHPPFALIARVLQKVVRDKVQRLVLVAPDWPSQHWWPMLQRLAVERPLSLSALTPDVLLTCGQNSPPEGHKRWRFSAWLLSAPGGA